MRVAAASVNPGDWYLLQGVPLLLRLGSGVRKPRKQILGLAFAGRVEAVAAEGPGLQSGTEVYGEAAGGGFAEYLVVPQAALALKPVNLTFEQAAAVPVVGTSALQALRDVGRLQAGQRVLITGASGGVGTFAVQIAKAFGAEVTGVCSTGNIDLVRSIGADHVIDYTHEDLGAAGGDYDLFLDNVGAWPLSNCRRLVRRGGVLIPNSNRSGRWIGDYVARAAGALVTSPFVPQRLRPFAAKGTAEQLAALGGLIESGKVTPVVDTTYPLPETATALEHYGRGHTRGKVIITMLGIER